LYLEILMVISLVNCVPSGSCRMWYILIFGTD